MHRFVALQLLGLAALLAGCSGEGKDKATGKGKPAAGATQAAAIVDIDPASRLDLDGGRVSVFSPLGWRRASRSYDYLVRYQSTPQLTYPAVVVLAADPPSGFAEVTADNHAAFVEAVTAQLGEVPGLLRRPARADVGPHHAVTWAAGGEATLDRTAKQIERECIAVVIAGRLYTVEAWAPRGKLNDVGRAAAKAVAAALAVPSLEPAGPLVPPAETEAHERVEPAEPAPPAAE
jgi:hypothetical protein